MQRAISNASNPGRPTISTALNDYIGPGIPAASVLSYKLPGGSWSEMSKIQPAAPKVGKLKASWPPKK